MNNFRNDNKDSINDKLIDLYKNKTIQDVIDYCNNLFKLLAQSENKSYWTEGSNHLFNFSILAALRHKKTNTSNVLDIAKSILEDSLINDKILNSTDPFEKIELEKAINPFSKNDKVTIAIISNALTLFNSI